MSETWGGDAIPGGGRMNLVEALSVAQHLPAEAIEEAVRRKGPVVDAILAVARRAAAGETLSAREQNLLLWGIHILGQLRDPRVFGPLLALLRRADDQAIELLGGFLDSTIPKVLIGTFDGDAPAFEDALSDPEGDEIARWCLFAAYGFLVAEGRIAHDRAHAFLVRFDDERLARAGDLAWSGWEDTIALLGFDDLAERRDAAVADARVLSDDEEGELAFSGMLRRTVLDGEDMSRFTEQGLGYLDDAVADLEDALASDEEFEAEAPVQNPFRNVGRNDPCPCGSGRKFKKCCLDASAA